ncbi:signal peptide peptidase-like 2C [Pteropus vampyrus]|uniref:Signal peptide peptidase-like 2C n=1 Tax=Pteropus vampyrus TaxID=132908 RepID=A0A6P3R5I7_PTEVA|nr:signal peptide peptidase-like 2C [Pteropus vampyrus]
MACLGFLLLLLTSAMAWGEYGVVHVVSQNWSKDYCMLFSSDYITLPRDLRHAPLLPLHDGTMAPWCPDKDPTHQAQPSPPSQLPLHRTTAMVMRGNCSFYAKGWLAQGQGAHGLLIVSRVSGQQCSDTTLASQDPRKPLPDLTIPVAVLRYTDMLDILGHTHGGAMVRVALYAPPEPILDYNMVVIFILAVGTVAAGGYWAGLTEADRLQRRRARGGGGPGGHNQQEAMTAQRGQEEDEDEPVDFTSAMTCAVVTMSCSIMLLLYFFYDHFVYVMIVIFGLGAGTGLYSCLAPLVRHLPPRPCQQPLPGRRACRQLALLLLAGLCMLVTVLWVAYRNEDRWAWLLQDTLGVAYCLFVLRRVRLPTLKNCTSFLLALLAFDVFFVFVTPLLTRTGESVMVEVASGPVGSLSHEEARVPAARACAARRPRERALSLVHALAVSVTHPLRHQHQHQHRRHRPPSAAATTDTFSSAFLYCPRPLSTIRSPPMPFLCLPVTLGASAERNGEQRLPTSSFDLYPRSTTPQIFPEGLPYSSSPGPDLKLPLSSSHWYSRSFGAEAKGPGVGP